MKTARFRGYYDDTFECSGDFDVDYDDCAKGSEMRMVVSVGDKNLIIVSGQHCPSLHTNWLLGVSIIDEDSKSMNLLNIGISLLGRTPIITVIGPDDMNVKLHSVEDKMVTTKTVKMLGEDIIDG